MKEKLILDAFKGYGCPLEEVRPGWWTKKYSSISVGERRIHAWRTVSNFRIRIQEIEKFDALAENSSSAIVTVAEYIIPNGTSVELVQEIVKKAVDVYRKV